MNFSPVTNYIDNVLCKEKGVPGCDLKIMQGHKTLLRHSFGVSDYEGKKAVSPEDIYKIYSCTKPITCAAALQLAEQGIINLDDAVSKYLPEYKDAFLIKEGKRISPKKVMTVRHLFTMSAGFNYDRAAKPIKDLLAEKPDAGTVDVANALVRSPLQFEPGEKFLYSLCHDVLGAVVETASGMKFSDYLNKYIFEPLGMKETAFSVATEKLHRRAAQYSAENGVLVKAPSYASSIPSDRYESGGGGLYSTVDDYSLFADAMANGGVGASGKRILKPETIDLMRTEQLKTYLMDSRFGCAAGPGYGYGLGVRTLIDKSGGQRSSIGEFGWDGAAGSYLMVDPKYNLSIFFAMQVLRWPAMFENCHVPIRDLTYEVLGL